MTTLLTVTDKGQITFSKMLLEKLGVVPGDRLAIKVEDKKAIIEPVGRGILDVVGTLPGFTLSKNKTLDQEIEEATRDAATEEIR